MTGIVTLRVSLGSDSLPAASTARTLNSCQPRFSSYVFGELQAAKAEEKRVQANTTVAREQLIQDAHFAALQLAQARRNAFIAGAKTGNSSLTFATGESRVPVLTGEPRQRHRTRLLPSRRAQRGFFVVLCVGSAVQGSSGQGWRG